MSDGPGDAPFRQTALLPFEELSRGEPDQRHVFAVRSDRVRSQVTGRELDVDRIVSPNWVNVVAFTPDNSLVLIRQYRQGTDSVTLETPGGIVDEGESYLEAARRELREETGYEADQLVEIGVVAPNPALQSNRW